MRAEPVNYPDTIVYGGNQKFSFVLHKSENTTMMEMREMRHRTKPSYVALNSDDEIDEVPILNLHKIKELPVKKSPFCRS